VRNLPTEGALPVPENQVAEDGASDTERLCAELEDAFRSGLEILPDTEPAMMAAVNLLAYFSTYQPLPASPQLRKIGYKDARKQLNDLARSAETLKACLDALSATAIDALADHDMQPTAKWYAAKMSSDLSALAIAARDSNVSKSRGKGREKHKRANGAACIVIDAYERITGCDADKPANIFSEKRKPRVLEPLVRKIFDVLRIRGNAKAAKEAALKERGQRQQKPSGREPLGQRITSEEFFERMRRTELAKRGPGFWKNKNAPPNNH
jgi:hypothetical protein